MKSRLAALAFVALLAAGGAGAYWHFYLRRDVADNQIRVSGNIETIEAEVAFKIPGRVEHREVDEGQWIEKGQVIARLEKADLECNVAMRKGELGIAEAALAALKAGSRPQEIAAAESAWKKAQHALADLEAGSRPQEITAAEAAVAAAMADVDRLRADYRRQTALFQRKTVTEEEFESARAAYQVAVEKHRQAVEQLKLAKEGYRKEQIEQARAALAQAKAQYDLVLAGPRDEDKQQGEARVAQAKAALAMAETQVSYATIVSPLSGVVLSKNIEDGDYVAPGTPVVTIGDLKNVWLRAYIQEADKDRVKFGQRARITTDTLVGNEKEACEGRVSFISQEAEFTPKNVQTQKERVKLVYRIKIDILNPGWEKKQWRLKPGMPADAVIQSD
jgi:HlyD family secretion protein